MRQLASSAVLEIISKWQSHDSSPEPSALALPTVVYLEMQNDLTTQCTVCSPREASGTAWILLEDNLESVAMEPTPRNTRPLRVPREEVQMEQIHGEGSEQHFGIEA